MGVLQMNYRFGSILLFLAMCSGLGASEEIALRSVQDRGACMEYIARVLPNCLSDSDNAGNIVTLQSDLQKSTATFNEITTVVSKEGFLHPAFADFQLSIEEFCDACALISERVAQDLDILPRHIRLLVRKASTIEKRLQEVSSNDFTGHVLFKIGFEYYRLNTLVRKWRYETTSTLMKISGLTGSSFDQFIDTVFFKPKDWFWDRRSYTVPVAAVAVVALAFGGYAISCHRKAKALEREAESLGDELPSFQSANLENLGLTCYANSALKLLSVHPARDALVGGAFVGKTKDGHIAKRSGDFRESLRELFANMEAKANRRGKISAGKVFGDFDKLHDFDDRHVGVIGKQRDSAEFLGKMLEMLAMDAAEEHCVIQREYTGCDRSNLRAHNPVANMRLDLNIVEGETKSIQDAFNSFWTIESVQGENNKKINLCNLPDSMIINLKRFEAVVSEGTCFQFKHDFAVEAGRTLIARTHDNQERSYSLKAVIIHSGSCYGGHYYTWIRDTHDGKDFWTKHDDIKDKVKLAASEQEALNDINSNGYVFLYVANGKEV
jgi:hypothetical protein